jgi:hypothetical protein
MGPPKASAGLRAPPHSSHSTAKTDEKGAEQLGQRERISPPHAGQADGSSASFSAK